MISVAIVEDNALEAESLSECLKLYEKEVNEQLSIKLFDSAFEFIDGYKADYDVVFMDIEMPDMDGMTAARRLRAADSEVFIIFVTNMAKYAVQGYQVNALDYFLKPVQYHDLKMRMERVRSAKKFDNEMISIAYQGGVKRFGISEIIYIESVSHTITYHTESGNYSCRGKSMRQLETELKDKGFSRCNTCYIVNLKFCREVKDNCVVVGYEELQISRSRKKQFIAELARSFRI